MVEEGIVLIIAIIFIASIIRSAFGFGDALVAMPLLAFLLDLKTAAPLIALLGFTSSIVILVRHWRSAYTKSLWILILFCILGIPAGIYFLKNTDDSLVKIFLAFIIIIFSSINLLKPNYFELKNERFAWLFGLISGILGGAYNTNGPPVIIYGKLKRWEPEKFRAILQSVFFPTNLFIIIGQASTGFWTDTVFKYYLYCLPFIFFGTYLGAVLNRKFSAGNFSKLVDIFLIIISIILFINAI